MSIGQALRLVGAIETLLLTGNPRIIAVKVTITGNSPMNFCANSAGHFFLSVNKRFCVRRYLLMVVILASVTTGSVISTVTAGAAEQIVMRNRWTNTVLLASAQGDLRMGVPGPNLDEARWSSIEVTDSGAVRLCNVALPDLCLQGSDGLSLGPARTAGAWKFEKGPKHYVRIASDTRPSNKLHIENGQQPGLSPAEESWWSAQWAVDEDLVRDARSVHLSYDVGEISRAYLEVEILESHPSTYFMAIGFSGGYFGVQQHAGDNGMLIFSLWDATTEKKRANVPAEDRARVVEVGRGATGTAFGNEGTGVSARLLEPVKQGDAFSFYLVAEIEDTDTASTRIRTTYTAYAARRGGAWRMIGKIDRPTTGTLIRGLYSFVEDYRRNGQDDGVAARDRSPYQRRTAIFRRGWVLPKTGSWVPIRGAKFTAWSPQPLESINASGVAGELTEGYAFRLDTGGNTVQSVALNSTIEAPTGPGDLPSMP